MSKRHTELMSIIGMVGAITHTYRNGAVDINDSTGKLLIAIDQYVASATRFFGRVGADNVLIVADKIDRAQADNSILGEAKDILTLIDYAVWLLETSMAGGKACGNIKGARGRVYLIRLVDALMSLRHELAGEDNHDACSISGVDAAENWMRI